jgi:16S rRNA (cytosine1402-N4)-methyltransferase
MHPETSDYHIPVLTQETLRYLALKQGETVLDATLGGGGHSARIAQEIQPGGLLIGLDRDPEAHEAAAARLASFKNTLNIILLRFPFGKLDFALESHPQTAGISLDGALFDLGVSSHQLDTERGFSFRRDEPLDMRMDTTTGVTAAELLATASEPEIARILWEYGEERFSRRIARAIVEQRAREPLRTTGQLAALIEKAVPRAAWPREIHVATRSFQGVRIAVNDEIGQLGTGLQAAVHRLKPGGRIVVISYHSLEDRIVKQLFAREAGRVPSASGMSPAALITPTEPVTLTLLTRKPVTPTPEEIAQNPRARSAKLRAAQKTAE